MSSQSISFDRAAPYYDDTRGFPPGVAARASDLFRVAGRLAPDQRVIEIGIGTGRIALPLAPHVQGIYGLDLARPMLEVLRGKQTTESIHVIEGDAVHLPYPDNAFQRAVTAHVFHLIPRWQDALRELSRVLQPNGLLLHTWTKGDAMLDPIFAAFVAALPPHKREAKGVRWAQRDTYLQDEGWQPAALESLTYPRTMIPVNFMEMVRHRKWASLWRMDDDEIERILAAVEVALHEHFADPKQPIETEERFFVWAFRPPES